MLLTHSMGRVPASHENEEPSGPLQQAPMQQVEAESLIAAASSADRTSPPRARATGAAPRTATASDTVQMNARIVRIECGLGWGEVLKAPREEGAGHDAASAVAAGLLVLVLEPGCAQEPRGNGAL